MSNAVVEQSKQSLRIYGSVLRIVGWLVLVGATAYAVVGFVEIISKRTSEVKELFFLMALSSEVGACILGVIILGLAQLLRYLFTDLNRPGWILRHGHWILYIYAIVVVSQIVIRYFYLMLLVHCPEWYVLLIPEIVIPAAKVLMLVGLGFILKRIMPIIKEARTLV